MYSFHTDAINRCLQHSKVDSNAWNQYANRVGNSVKHCTFFLTKTVKHVNNAYMCNLPG